MGDPVKPCDHHQLFICQTETTDTIRPFHKLISSIQLGKKGQLGRRKQLAVWRDVVSSEANVCYLMVSDNSPGLFTAQTVIDDDVNATLPVAPFGKETWWPSSPLERQ